jgi:hypothetical protein
MAQGPDVEGALRHQSGLSARLENDRKTTGFTRLLRPEYDFGKEKVKVLGGQPVENSNFGHFGHLWSSPRRRTSDEKTLTGKNR